MVNGGPDEDRVLDEERVLREARETVAPHLDALSEDTFLAQDVEHPSWAPGPFRLRPELTFELEGQWADPAGVGWESASIFNPSLIPDGDKLHVFYRASPRKESLSSRIGHAVLTDAGWHDDPGNPVVLGTEDNETLGVEDPKVYRGPEGWVLFYNGIFRPTSAERSAWPSPGHPIEEVGCDINVATSPDLRTWTKRGSVVDRAQSRLWAKGAVIPRDGDGRAVAIGGEYFMYVSEGFGGVLHVGRSTDLLRWRFEPVPYLDLGELGGHLHEVATATVVEDRLVLDFFYRDMNGRAAARAEYALDEPFTPRRFARGGTLAWGGLTRWRGDWLFAQGWDAAFGRRQLLFYSTTTRTEDPRMTRPTTTALFTGDSITDMGRRTDPSGFLGAGYVRRIAEMAAEGDPHLVVVNTGVSGDRTTDLIARWDADVIQRRPDVLTILIGANDMWRRYDSGMPMTAEEFAANYASLLDRVRDELELRQLVLMEPFLVPVRDEQRAWRTEDLDAKRAVTRELAARYGAVFIPLDGILGERAAAAGPASVIEDGVHPSAGGHELIARSWWEAVAPTLR